MSYTLTGAGGIQKTGNFSANFIFTGNTSITIPISGTLISAGSDATNFPNGIIYNRTPISLSGGNYAVLLTDFLIGVTSLTATSTVTLPNVGTASIGQTFVVTDESGNGRSYRSIKVKVSGGADINGSTTHTIGSAYGSRTFYNTGTKYVII